MSERAPRFASAKVHEGDESARVKIEVQSDEPEKKEHSHPKRRRGGHAHHAAFHRGHTSESARPKHRPTSETSETPEVIETTPAPEAILPAIETPELEGELRQLSKLANIAMEPAPSEAVETSAQESIPDSEPTIQNEAPDVDPQSLEVTDTIEQSNPYALKDFSPEEDPEVLTVEAEFIEPEQIDMTPEPIVEAPVEEVEQPAEPEAPVEAEVEVPEPAHTPKVGDPAELNGQEVQIEKIFADDNGTSVYGVVRNDGSKELVYAEQLVFIDTEKEKALRAERLKELFDEHSGFLKGILQIAHVARLMANPKDRTIRRGVRPSATFEDQDAAFKKNRLSLLAGIQSVSVEELKKLSKGRVNEPLFGTGVAIASEVVLEEGHFTQGALDDDETEATVELPLQTPEQEEAPLAVSVKALG